MIKFFRKIRARLLSENKVGNYLAYAVGEILLVVIGILIALNINNWNTNRLNKKIEQEYLTGLRDNISSDIRELERHFRTDTIKLNAYTYLIKEFSSNPMNLNDTLIIASIYPTLRTNWFEGNNVIFDDLKSSGRMNMISSKIIRNQIQVYYRLFEEIVKRENFGNTSINHYHVQSSDYFPAASFIEPTFQEEGWNSNVGPPNLAFLEDMDVAKYIDVLSIMKTYQYTNYKSRMELYVKAVELKNEIENHLQS